MFVFKAVVFKIAIYLQKEGRQKEKHKALSFWNHTVHLENYKELEAYQGEFCSLWRLNRRV